MLFNTDLVNFLWKTDEVESIVLIFVLWRCLNLRWMRGGAIVSFSSWSLTFKSNLIFVFSNNILLHII